jgi:hypothetical protein
MADPERAMLARPAPASELADRFLAAAPALLEALGAPGATAPGWVRSRTWSPMDGAQPPECPFEDRWTARWAHDGWDVSVSANVARWNEREISNADAGVHVARGDTAIAHVFGAVTNTDAVDGVWVRLYGDPDGVDARTFRDWLSRVLMG